MRLVPRLGITASILLLLLGAGCGGDGDAPMHPEEARIRAEAAGLIADATELEVFMKALMEHGDTEVREGFPMTEAELAHAFKEWLRFKRIQRAIPVKAEPMTEQQRGQVTRDLESLRDHLARVRAMITPLRKVMVDGGGEKWARQILGESTE